MLRAPSIRIQARTAPAVVHISGASGRPTSTWTEKANITGSARRRVSRPRRNALGSLVIAIKHRVVARVRASTLVRRISMPVAEHRPIFLLTTTALALAVVCVGWMLSERDPVHDTRLPAAHKSSGSGNPAGPSRTLNEAVAPRPADSAALVTNWTSPNADLDRVNQEAQYGRDPLDLVFEDYENNAELVHWATGDADATPKGNALAKCYAQSIGALDERCTWDQRVVVHRVGPREGEVVHVVQAFGEVAGTCERLIACVNEAWRGASAPMPPGTDEYVTLEFVGDPCFLGEGKDDLLAAFGERETHASDYIESMASCDRQVCLYNRRRELSCLTHLVELQQALRLRE
jgi:hypothetical protein